MPEKAAKEAARSQGRRRRACSKGNLGLIEQDRPSAYAIPVKQDRLCGGSESQGKGDAHYFPEGQEPKYDKLRIAAVSRTCFNWKANESSAGTSSDTQAIASTAAIPRPSDRVIAEWSGRPAPRPRFGAVHPRRDPGDWS